MTVAPSSCETLSSFSLSTMRLGSVFYARLKAIIAAAGVDCDIDNSRVVVDPSFEVDDDEDVAFDQAPLFY